MSTPEPPQSVERRREARERALALLYEAEAKGVAPAELLASLPVAPDPFAVELVTGVGDTMDQLDKHIGAVAKGWTVARMPAIDRALLRVGCYELLHSPDTPTGSRHQRGGRARGPIFDRRLRPIRERRAVEARNGPAPRLTTPGSGLSGARADLVREGFQIQRTRIRAGCPGRQGKIAPSVTVAIGFRLHVLSLSSSNGSSTEGGATGSGALERPLDRHARGATAHDKDRDQASSDHADRR